MSIPIFQVNFDDPPHGQAGVQNGIQVEFFVGILWYVHDLRDEHLLKVSTSHVLPTMGYQGSQRRGWVGRFHLAPRCCRTWVVRQCISHLVVTLKAFVRVFDLQWDSS